MCASRSRSCSPLWAFVRAVAAMQDIDVVKKVKLCISAAACPRADLALTLRTSNLTGALKPRSNEGTGRSGTSVNTNSCWASSRSSTSVVGAAPFSCP